MLRFIRIFSVKISAAKKSLILNLAASRIQKDARTVIFTPNTQMLLAARKNPALRELLDRSTVNIPDGIGVCMAARILNGKRLERCSGIDFAEELLKISEQQHLRVFFLGGECGVADQAKKAMKKRFSRICICGTHHGYFDKYGKENSSVLKKINSARPDLLFVCFGFPLQEEWILKNIDRLPSVKLAIGLGGTFDVWSGRCKRAPSSVQKLGLEWLWRMLRDPRRAKTAVQIPEFLWLVIKSKAAFAARKQ